MPIVAKELKPAKVATLGHDGGKGHTFHPVGGVPGLMLQVTAGAGRSWIMRVRIKGQRRHFGLGGYPEVSLAEARDRARDVRNAVKDGADPVEAWRTGTVAREFLRRGLTVSDAWINAKAQRTAQLAAAAMPVNKFTFADAVRDYLKTGRITKLENDKHRKQWASTLNTYAIPIIGKMAVADIGKKELIEILSPIWNSKRETAARLRGRIEAVLNSERAASYRNGENPASAVVLKNWISEQGKADKDNHPALSLDDLPRWWKALQKREGIGARALEFLALTAARSGEVRGATWDEFDLEKALWIIPAHRMKMEREHRVPLTADAIALLKSLPTKHGVSIVFSAPQDGQLSDMTLSATMKRIHETQLLYDALAARQAGRELPSDQGGFRDRRNKRPAVPHGLRSAFRDWVAERTTYPGDMAEMALAHKIGNAVEASYRRGDMIEKRRAMMADWGAFLRGEA